MTAASAVRPAGAQRAIGRLDWICLLLVTHGSLYPWRFAWPKAGLPAAWAELWQVTSWWTNLGDVVGNVVLFVPVGLLMLLHLEAGTPPRRRLPAMLVLGTLFAWLLQVLQIFVPARDPELSDVAWNALGLLLGAALARLLRPASAGERARVLQEHGVALGLAALWLVLEWWPLTPTLDWQQVKDAFKPLLRDPAWHPLSAFEAALGVLSLAHLLRGLPRRGPWVPAALVLALGAKPFIAGQTITLSHASGCLLGLAASPLLARLAPQRAATTLLLAAWGWLTVDELRPFGLAEQASAFEFVPFVALLHGSMEANTFALVTMAYWIGLVLLLGQQLGARLGGLTLFLSLWLLALEGAQTWLPQRTADITPALLPWLWLVLLQPLAALPAPAPPLSRRPRRRRAAR